MWKPFVRSAIQVGADLLGRHLDKGIKEGLCNKHSRRRESVGRRGDQPPGLDHWQRICGGDMLEVYRVIVPLCLQCPQNLAVRRACKQAWLKPCNSCSNSLLPHMPNDLLGRDASA